jgi:hypothetical protein
MDFMEKIPVLCQDEVLWRGGVVEAGAQGDDVCVPQGSPSPHQDVTRAMECPVRYEACRILLETAGQICDGDKNGTALIDEINRRLGVLSLSHCHQVGLLEALEEGLGPLYPWFRLIWEWQRRIRRGVPGGGGGLQEVRVMRVEEWQGLDLQVGCVLCILGFSMVKSVTGKGPIGRMAVRERDRSGVGVEWGNLEEVGTARSSWLCVQRRSGFAATVCSAPSLPRVGRVKSACGGADGSEIPRVFFA